MQTLEQLAYRHFTRVVDHPIPVLIAAGLVAALLAAFIPGLGRDTSPDSFIPADHPALELDREVREQFHLKEQIVVAIIRDQPDGIFTPAGLELVASLTRSIQALPLVGEDRVLSLATVSGVEFEDGLPGFHRLMKEPPSSAAEASAIAADVLDYELYRGTLVAPDKTAATIVVRLDDDSEAEAVYRQLLDLIAETDVGDAHVVVAGEAAVRTHMGKAVSDDALRMNFICPVVMALLIVLAFRTGRGTLLPLSVIGGASAAALGTMSLAGVPVYIITNGIFVVIMALGVADSLHLLGQYYEEQLNANGRGRRALIVDASMALFFPILITTLTDVAGFMALFVSGVMPPIRAFGLYTAIGVVGALIYSYTVVPAGLAILPLAPSRCLGPTHGGDRFSSLDTIGRVLAHIGAFVCRRHRLVVTVAVAVVGVSLWGARHLVVNDARILAFRADHPIVIASNELDRRFDGTNELHIVLTAADDGAMLEPSILAEIEKLEAFTESLATVGGTHSLTGWIKRAHQKMNNESPAMYRIPDSPEETRFYLDVLSAASSPMAELLAEIVDGSYRSTNLIVRMRSTEFVDERRVVEAIEAYVANQLQGSGLEVELAGRVMLDYHWLGMVRESHISSVILATLCVFLLTGLMFRSIVAGLLCTLAVAMAVLVNYAVMGYTGISLGVGTSMFASIAIGAGVNYPILLLDRLRTGLAGNPEDPAAVITDSLAFTGRSLFFTAFIVAVGFSLLIGSEFRTLVRFGSLIGLSTVVSFVTSITLVPALVILWRPRFLFQSAAAR